MEESVQPPEPADDDDDDESGGAEAAPAESGKPAGRKVPRPDKLEDKWFMLGLTRPPAVAVTVADSEIPRHGARAGITGKILEAIDQLIEALGGGVPPVLAGAVATNSITIYLDDPTPTDEQTALPVEFTLGAARRVQSLIDLEDDALFEHALALGPEEAKKYVDFVHLLATNDVSVTWEPRDSKSSVLRADRAIRQYSRLTAEPEMRDRTMTLIGLLYRVIADPTKVEGSLGIKLSKESPQPTVKKKSWVNVFFDRDQLESIKGLVGEAVEARVRFMEPVPGTGIAPEQPRVELVEIEQRPKPLTIEELLGEDDPDAE
jgi:hypothetical protein